MVVFSILLAYATYRRRRLARANMAFVHAAQNQQQGYVAQYPPPPPQEGFLGQKAQQGYDPQQYGQYSPQYNPQYNQQSPQYSGPQYPPAAYDQGNSTQPVSTIPTMGLASFHLRLVGASVPWLWATAWSSPPLAWKPLRRVENWLGSTSRTVVPFSPLALGPLYFLHLGIHDDFDDVINFAQVERWMNKYELVKSLDEDRDRHRYTRHRHVW